MTRIRTFVGRHAIAIFFTFLVSWWFVSNWIVVAINAPSTRGMTFVVGFFLGCVTIGALLPRDGREPTRYERRNDD